MMFPPSVTRVTSACNQRKGGFDALLAAAEDAIDHAAIDAQERREAEQGVAAARADYLPGRLVDRLLAGESPVRVWREHRGMTSRRVATEAGVSVSYLSEIETGHKPGSPIALRAVAQVLRVPMADLVTS